MASEVKFVSLTKEQYNKLDKTELVFKNFIPDKSALDNIEDPKDGDVYITINDGAEENREFYIYQDGSWSLLEKPEYYENGEGQ